MGYTIRSKDFRYTEWRRFNCSIMSPMTNCAADKEAVPQWGDAELWGVELYDHTGDPSTSWSEYENINLAANPSYAATAQQLHTLLHSSWAAPEGNTDP